MNALQHWYIVKTPEGTCQIISSDREKPPTDGVWGPYSSQAEAIQRRVGLIRAGKCRPQ
ncbi:MAG: hypothetical protein HC890_01975 [Chloroflexaceae bacterium]|nr:hypothetical protein [Chloroflexaceae bacterium]